MNDILKKIFITFLVWPFFCFSQDYVDVLKLGYGRSVNNKFEGSDGSTYITSLEANLTMPIVLNQNNAILTVVFSVRIGCSCFLLQMIIRCHLLVFIAQL